MLAAAKCKNPTVEARLLAMADGLFSDFDALPVKVVFDAINSARRALRLQRLAASPEAIEDLARARLNAVRAA